MKKIISIIAVFFLGLSQATAQKIFVEDFTAPEGGTQQFEVKYTTNGKTMVGYIFKFELPEGLTFVTDKTGLPAYEYGKDNDLFNITRTATGFQASPNSTSAKLVDGEGTLLKLTFQVGENLKEGDVATVKVYDASLTSKEGDSFVDNDTPEFEFKVTIVENRITLDETSTTAPTAAENVNVLVKRSVKAGNWGTICLPFAMTEDQVKAAFGDGAQLADFTGAEIVRDAEDLVSEIKVKFVTASSIEANHPYLLKLDKEFGDIKYEDGFKVDGVTINAKTTPQVGFDYNDDSESYLTFFRGVYVPTVLSNNRFMFLSGNKFYYTDTNTTIKGFRGYFRFRSVLADKYKNNSANVKIFVDEEATNIDNLVTPRVAEGVYDLSGRKIQLENGDLNKLQKGVYIIDGKKVTIK